MRFQHYKEGVYFYIANFNDGRLEIYTDNGGSIIEVNILDNNNNFILKYNQLYNKDIERKAAAEKAVKYISSLGDIWSIREISLIPSGTRKEAVTTINGNIDILDNNINVLPAVEVVNTNTTRRKSNVKKYLIVGGAALAIVLIIRIL